MSTQQGDYTATVINDGAPCIIPPTGHESQQQQCQNRISKAYLLLVSIELIKLQLLPYLTNRDCGALFDSCGYLRTLKKTEFIFKFKAGTSLRYATDTSFREQAHMSALINIQRCGKRMIHLYLYDRYAITDLSKLGEVKVLAIPCYEGEIDAISLRTDQMLDLMGCANILNLDAFIRRLVAVLRTDSTSNSSIYSAQGLTYHKECAAYSLASIAFTSDSNRQLIVDAGGIGALIAVLFENSNDVKLHAVKALYHLAAYMATNQVHKQLIVTGGGITALLFVLCDVIHQSCAELRCEAISTLYSLLSGREMNQQLFVAEDGINLLFSMLGDVAGRPSVVASIKMHATSLLATLAANSEANRSLIVTTLLTMLRNATSECSSGIRDRVVKALAQLAGRSEDSKALIVAEGGIPALIAILQDTSEQSSPIMREEAVRTLFLFVRDNEANQQLLISAGGIRALITALDDFADLSGDWGKEELVAILAALAATSETNCLLIVTELIAILRDDGSRVAAKEGAARALAKVAQSNEESRQLIVGKDGVPVLMDLLRETSDQSHNFAGQQAILALIILVADDEMIHEQLLIEEGDIAAMVTGLGIGSAWSIGSEDVQLAKMLTAVASLSKADRQLIITELISVLRSTTTQSNRGAKDVAAKALVELANNSEINKQLIVVKGGISVLIASLLNDPVPRYTYRRSNIALALVTVVAGNEIYLQLLVAENGIKALIVGLGDVSDRGSSDGKWLLAETLADVAALREANQRLIITNLIAVLHNTRSQRSAREEAVMTLATLADRSLSNQKLIVRKHGIPVLVAVLRDESEEETPKAKYQAAKVLGEFSRHCSSNRQLIADEGGIPALLALLDDHYTGEENLTIVKALASLTAGSQNIKQLIANEGGVAVMISLLSDEFEDNSVEIKECAAIALAYLAAGDEGIKQLIVERGGIPTLIAVLGNDFEEISIKLKEFAVRAIVGLATGNESIKQLIVAAGGIPALIEVLNEYVEDSSVKAKQYSIRALVHLATGNESIKQLIAAEEGIAALIEGLNSTGDTQQCCAGALSVLAAEDESIKQLIVAQYGIQALIALLCDGYTKSSTDAKKSASKALCVILAAGDQSTEQLIVAKGCITSLVAILTNGSEINHVDSDSDSDTGSDPAAISVIHVKTVLFTLATENERLRRIIIPALIATAVASANSSPSTVMTLLRELAGKDSALSEYIRAAGGQQFL